MKRQAGLTLVELLISIGVSLGMMASILGLAASARTSAAQAELEAATLAVISAMAGQREFDPTSSMTPAGWNSGPELVRRNSGLQQFWKATAARFEVGGAALETTEGRLSVGNLTTAQCLELTRRLLVAVPASQLSVNGAAAGSEDLALPGTLSVACSRRGQMQQGATVVAAIY